MNRLLLAGLLLLLLAAGSRTVLAQDPLPRYLPYRSPISPYMNFFLGPNPGPIDRYNAYVRPSLQLRQTVRGQEMQINRLQGDLQQVRQSGLGPTGVGGSFDNLSHYYPGGVGPRRR